MKAKYLIPLAMAFGLTAQSCGDFLDTDPAAIYSEDLVWGSAANVEAFVLGQYGNVMQYYRNVTMDKDFTNNMIACRSAAPNTVRGLMENTYNAGINDRFGIIRACNMIIERCGNSTVLDDIDKRKYVALGKLMRAMVYYDLARKTGKFIWVDKVLSSDDPDFNLPLTKSIEESYSYVLKDLREAIPDLPTNEPYGALNKAFGQALLSEALLTAAAYCGDAASLQNNGKSLYQEAIDVVDAISGYSLDPNFGGIFNEEGATSSPEIILADYWDKDQTWCQSTMMINLIANVTNTKVNNTNCGPEWTNPDIFECWMEYAPSQNLADAYLVIDRKDGKAKPWNQTSQWLENTREVGQNEIFELVDHRTEDVAQTGYVLTNPDLNISNLMYDNRDARFDATILHDGSQFYGETLAMCSHGNMSRWTTTAYFADHVPVTNMATRKTIYTNMSPRPFYNTNTAWHSMLMRYGRALLNKAEAQLCLGRVSDAVATFNQTRTIHGQLPASTASTSAEAWADYKRERRCELFWEDDFYYSLLRWGKIGGDANDGRSPGSTIDELTVPATYIEINPERNAAYVGEVQMYNDQRAFPLRQYLFPIPQSLINANSAITNADQNPGWE